MKAVQRPARRAGRCADARSHFGHVVTWRVENVRRFGQAPCHALQWKIKSAASRSSAHDVRCPTFSPADPGLTGAGDRSRLKPNRASGTPRPA